MSFTFVVSNCDGKCHINTRFNPPLELDKNKRYEMALVNLELIGHFQILMIRIMILVSQTGK